MKDQLTDYAMLIDRMGEIAEASMPNPSEGFSHNLGLPEFSDDESILASEPDSDISDDSHEKVVEDFTTWMDALIGLSPSLACPAPDDALLIESDAVLSEEIGLIPDSYRSFVIAIKDAFPLISTKLAKRLGEGNLKRIERLRDVREGKFPAIPMVPVWKIRQDINPGGNSRGAAHSDSGGFSMSDPSVLNRSISTGNSGSGPSIFDRNIVQRPTISPTNSVVSLSPSTGTGESAGRRQLPPLPLGCDFGEPIQCPICNLVLQNVRNLNEWQLVIE